MNEVSLAHSPDGHLDHTGSEATPLRRWRSEFKGASVAAAGALAVLIALELASYRSNTAQELIFIGYFIPVAVAARFLRVRAAILVTAVTITAYFLAFIPHYSYASLGAEGIIEVGARCALFAATGIGLSLFRRSIIVEKERALAAEHERVKRLKLMVDVSKTVTSSLKIEQVLQVLSVRIAQAIEASFCMVALLDQHGENLKVVAAHPVRRDIEWSSFIGQSLPLADLPDFERAISSREMVIVGGRREEVCKVMPLPERSIMHNAKSVLLFPLVVSDIARGVVCIGEQRSWDRSPMDLERADLCRAIVNQGAVAVGHALTHEAMEEAFAGTIKSLAETIDAKDPSTRGHSDWVSKYALMIGRALGFSDDDLEMLRFAGYLHDIGKIGIPDEVLGKPQQLSTEEWRLMKKHPIVSSKILDPVKLPDVIKEAVRHHHERFDGKGYPYGLSGEAIPLEARILAVADAFEAMTSDRPYRKALSDEQAVAELRRCCGSQFDPQVVEYFLRALGRSSSFEEDVEGTTGFAQAG
ncbi:MAG: HD domain-containing protein [Gaiellales bacterium]|nr:MAG: HD domain-containing protein [Gaiellales bacterium]